MSDFCGIFWDLLPEWRVSVCTVARVKGFFFFFCIQSLRECLRPRRAGGDLSLSTMTMSAIKNTHSTL